jgi:very-short-patch-repair endonuclease
MVNGAKLSKQQMVVAEILGAQVNYSPGASRRYIDCALPDQKIAVEYDGWYWHGHRVQEDYERAQELINDGWRVLSIKSGNEYPSAEQLEEAVEQLGDYPYIELILSDWGNGPTAQEVLR